MSSVDPIPCCSGSNGMDCSDTDVVVGGDSAEDFTGLTTGTDSTNIVNSELPTGAGVGKVAHVLSMVPEVQMAQIDTSKVSVVAGVKDVGLAGVTVMENPHRASGCHVGLVNPGDTSVISEHLTIVSNGKGCLSEEVENGPAFSDLQVRRSGFSGSFLTDVMQSAQSVASMRPVASGHGATPIWVLNFYRSVSKYIAVLLPSGVVSDAPTAGVHGTSTIFNRTLFHMGKSSTAIRKVA